MARKRKSEVGSHEGRGASTTSPNPPAPSPAELRQQMLDEAQRLRSLAATARGGITPPNVDEYLRTGRGPSYHRDNDRWKLRINAVYAFEAAAARLEESATYSPPQVL